MANSLPWFKHDHNARNDDFVKRMCERFGHFGYSGWFRMIETMHEHGTVDKLCITRSRFAAELGSKWPPVRNLLDFCQQSGKVLYSENGQELIIEIKNFRKKQENKHRKTVNDTGLEKPKAVLDIDVDVEGDNSKLGFMRMLNGITAKVAGWRYDAAALEAHQFPFGKEKGRPVINMEPSRCQWYLDRIQMDAKTTAALKHRIKLKQGEIAR